MTIIGYAHLIETLKLKVMPIHRQACISTSVNRRVENNQNILFPTNLALDNSLIGHLEFAIRHEGLNLEVIDATFEHIDQDELIAKFKLTPAGASIRRLCFLWEWLTGKNLELEFSVSGAYVDLFPADEYYTAAESIRVPKFRIRNNALGNADFCPTVRRKSIEHSPSFSELIDKANTALNSLKDPELYRRAVAYLYLSETKGSYAIESEKPSSDKQERFVQLLKHAGESVTVTEDWLVQLQNAIVRDVYSYEASYRTKQNWLEDSSERITFLPTPIAELRQVMGGWERFVNDTIRCKDPLVKAACAAFGFVYIHPFLDGNGRLHRFIIQHVLAQSALLPRETIIPVSAVIEKNVAAYFAVLSAFSKEVTKLWNYRRTDTDPIILSSPGSRPYRFFDAGREIQFLYEMVKVTVQDEIPRELAWLQSYDRAFTRLNKELDLPQKDLAALIRMIYSNKGILSENRRKQYAHLPEHVLNLIENIVKQECQNNQTDTVKT